MLRPHVLLVAALLLAGCGAREPPADEACPRLEVSATPREAPFGEPVVASVRVTACGEPLRLPSDGCGVVMLLQESSGRALHLVEEGPAHEQAPEGGCGGAPATLRAGESWNTTRTWDGRVVADGVTEPAPAGRYVVELRVLDETARASVRVLEPGVRIVAQANDSFRTLARGSLTGLEEDDPVVVEEEEAWRAAWERHGSNEFPPPDMPDVDFARERVVFALVGPRPSDCWGVEVVRARTDEAAGVTTLELVIHEPEPGAACAPFETRPYHVVALAKLPTRLAFETRTGPEGEP
ncbi:MAG TPA: hypothetical protein VFH78_05690 [Candidatus Thermoplasmatota archaeon]|nr:hypothetical protein [Candidatus Thermoplasmatota archaeon]